MGAYMVITVVLARELGEAEIREEGIAVVLKMRMGVEEAEGAVEEEIGTAEMLGREVDETGCAKDDERSMVAEEAEPWVETDELALRDTAGLRAKDGAEKAERRAKKTSEAIFVVINEWQEVGVV
jgi:hypothetical protein